MMAAAFALMSALVAATLGWLDAPLSTFSWLASGFWFLGMLVSWNRARSARRLGAQAEERAWVDVTEEAVASFPAVTESQLAELLGVDQARAEGLLTELVREDRVASEIDEHARVLYALPGKDAEPPRVRVDSHEFALEHADEDEDEQVEPARRKRL